MAKRVTKRGWVKVLTADEKAAALTLDGAPAEVERMMPPL